MLRSLLTLLFLACCMVRAGEGLDLRKLPALRYTIAAPTPGRVVVSVENPSAEKSNARIERGTVFVGASDRGKLIALRSAEAAINPKGAAELSIPAAALASRGLDRAQTFAFSDETIPTLGPLLAFLQSHDDLPADTAQLLVLCFQENLSFANWKEFLARRSAAEKTSMATAQDEVVTAIDALGVLRQVAPQRTFALAADPELKLRALRHPVARGKAMKLYGIDLPEAPLPPDLGTLLHTKPNDNCPICRQRALMQPREDGL